MVQGSGDIREGSVLQRLVSAALGDAAARQVLGLLDIDPALLAHDQEASRAQMAMALNCALYSGLIDRVPSAAAYVARVRAEGRRICFDHGALRTIDGPTGALPRGHGAFARLLEPLGYRIGGLYPLPRLKMTGRALVHQDFPQAIPQFFVSELHVALLPPSAQEAAARVFASSRDPLAVVERQALARFAADGCCPIDLAMAALPGLVGAFARQHDVPMLEDYLLLLDHSGEAAWIATEGNSFNHATDRVADVERLADDLRARGMPMKQEVEISANRRVRQTAFIADRVQRPFRLADSAVVQRDVPGSFYEFITRAIDPATGALDLTFDSGNATGIFAVTSAT